MRMSERGHGSETAAGLVGSERIRPTLREAQRENPEQE